MRKKMQKLIMYYDAHQLNREGLRPSQIARQLGLDYRTVEKYLSICIEEYESFIEKHSNRDKILAPYENFIKTQMEACAEASAAQVHDCLKDHFDDFIEGSAWSGIYVKELTDTYAMEIMSETMDFCIHKKIYKATDLGIVAKTFNARKSQQSTC